MILSQILSQEARARRNKRLQIFSIFLIAFSNLIAVNTLKTAKPEKAKAVEDILINNARMGVIGGKLSESDLIGVLEKINQQFSKETKVKFDRRRANLDSDED
ncbi:programmed cell death protein 5-like protein [Leptotrombidium deliense]|uniref:Programmed cell death protein 5-like protein n=1 Tax=Leptotrombidium deliense TaxID=299467 RepID=A0A443SAZ2_9ACAR|nr:programmed cell death protein 5-like protein [Leptotrombidium deliense]